LRHDQLTRLRPGRFAGACPVARRGSGRRPPRRRGG
jgi:peptide/nickel transport system substrate-binding protein